jgi:hypothetical protein
VLLKNDDSILPLKKGSKIALVGPHTNGREVFMSNYHGARCPSGKFECIKSPLEAISTVNTGGSTSGVDGVDVASVRNNISAAVASAKAADAVVLLVGIDGSQEGEEHDRYNCTLPGLQPDLVKAITALKKPTVMVLIHGGAMCLGELKDAVPAIVDAFYGGENGADALAMMLFGDYNPSGKLPITMYPPEYLCAHTDVTKCAVGSLPLTQMSVSAPPGRTHLYYSGKPEFAFGSGLSYSHWSLSAAVSQSLKSMEAAGGSTTFLVHIANHGPFPGAQRVLVFVRPRVRMFTTMPVQKLIFFDGVHANVGQSTTLSITVHASLLAFSNEAGDRVVYPGNYDIVFSDGVNQEIVALHVAGNTTVVRAM